MSSEAVPTARPPSAEAATRTGLMAAAELHPGDVLAGRFRIEALLGMGGMGVVYRARDLSLDIDVALKLLRPELARRPEAFERFRQELLLARQVSSPHVVRIHDIAQHEGRWFISMDYVAGESLEHRLDRDGRLPLAQAVAIARGLLDGLAAAHARGVVHRDLKPANVLIDADGRAVLTDFGVARSLGATGATHSGTIVGTPEYLSPEQARGDAVDARSDLYAVGLILYEMLSGSLPFAGGTPAETVIQRLVRPPPPLARRCPDLPTWLLAFSERLLKLQPAHRFASASEALRALDSRRVPRAPIDRRVWLGALLALVAALGVGAWLLRHPAILRAPVAALAPSVPRVAVLPLAVAGDDPALAPLARVLEEHLHEWLRGDAAQAVVPRRRVLDALARAAPGLQGEALQRQLDDVARAASAGQLWHGSLRREGQTLLLQLQRLGGPVGEAPLQVRGADAAALFAAYREALAPRLARSDGAAAAAPAWPGNRLDALGQGLLALDRRDFGAAAAALAPLAAGGDALVQLRLLDAQEGAEQALPAQATRRAALAAAAEATPAGRLLRARAQAGEGQNDAATRTLTEAQRAYPHDADVALADAERLAADGDGKAAQSVLEALVAADAQDARAWFLLGRTAIQQGQAQAAVDDYLVRALVLVTRAGDPRAQGEVRNALGVGYERLGQLDAAAEAYAAAATLREQAGDRRGLATSLRNLAIVQAVRGDRAQAEKTLDRAGALLQALGDRASLADLHNDRGVVAEERGDFIAALAAYRDALALRQQLDLPDAVAQSLNNIAFCQYQLGAFDDALVYWQQAQAAYTRLDDRTGALRAQQSIGLLEIARGHFDAAQSALQASLRQAEDHQLPEEAAVAHTYLGELRLQEGRLAQAYAEADAAAQGFARREDLRGRNESALLRARIALALGDATAAAQALAPLAANDLGAEQQAAWRIADAGRAALQGDTAAAIKQLDDAAAAAGAAHQTTLALHAGLERVRLALATNDVAGARRRLSALRADIERSNQVPLRLVLLELTAATALREGERTQAALAYRTALGPLQPLRWRDASLLHALGAAALPAGAEAEAARRAADAAQTQLLQDAPAEARTALRAHLSRRWREESGRADTD